MNNFFFTIGETLSDKIPKAKNPLLDNDYDVNPQKTKFKFHVIGTFQLCKVLGKFKTSKGCGNDGIASCFLKIALPVISESLCDIFNLSVATGCFPDSWKIARVAPIFKSGQPNDFGIVMGSCFPGSTSLCSPVVCKYSLRYLVFLKFLYCIIKKNLTIDLTTDLYLSCLF